MLEFPWVSLHVVKLSELLVTLILGFTVNKQIRYNSVKEEPSAVVSDTNP